MNNLSSTAELISAITDAQALAGTDKRLIVALAGAPASGKSTLAQTLVDTLGAEIANVVPMDGFHLDNTLLDIAGLREFKGAPETFDVAGFESLLFRIRHDNETVHIPVFDRAADLSRAAAESVEPRHRIIVVEGNYLLLNQPGWRSLKDCFDLTVLLDVSWETLKTRSVARWLSFDHTPEEALARAEQNDLPNGDTVRRESQRPDIVYRFTDDRTWQ
ncbi:MAG: hypothetical protein V3U76_13265 [Granulosicoccus sp.]